jgi:hypothetical protein
LIQELEKETDTSLLLLREQLSTLNNILYSGVALTSGQLEITPIKNATIMLTAAALQKHLL